MKKTLHRKHGARQQVVLLTLERFLEMTEMPCASPSCDEGRNLNRNPASPSRQRVLQRLATVRVGR